jgi:orotate phosphoribosyltransferase
MAFAAKRSLYESIPAPLKGAVRLVSFSWIAGPAYRAVMARERLFDAFERLERDEDETGMGLGLSVVRSVAQGHGGSVRIEDGDGGVGTRVVVEIPLAP